MARLFRFCIALTALFLVEFAVAADPPEMSPVPAPQSGAGDVSPSPHISSPHYSPHSPSPSSSPSPYFESPPAPPPAFESSPAPSPSTAPSPTPSPSVVGDLQHTTTTGSEDGEEGKSSGGLTGGQKAGVALAAIAFVAILGFAGVVYKKRNDNIRRSRYGLAARRDIL